MPKKPVVVYSGVNQPLMQTQPNMLDELDEYQLNSWRYKDNYRGQIVRLPGLSPSKTQRNSVSNLKLMKNTPGLDMSLAAATRASVDFDREITRQEKVR